MIQLNNVWAIYRNTSGSYYTTAAPIVCNWDTKAGEPTLFALNVDGEFSAIGESANFVHLYFAEVQPSANVLQAYVESTTSGSYAAKKKDTSTHAQSRS